MYTNLQLALKYVQHQVQAKNSRGHGMHSPFVFSFIRNVLRNQQGYDMDELLPVETCRRQMLKDERVLMVEDYGAGSRVSKTRDRNISRIARTSLKPPRISAMFYRLVKHYRPEHILELGTSLGITTATLAKAAPTASIVTVEGSSAIAAVARENFRLLHCDNIHLEEGRFEDVLAALPRYMPVVDLAYVDGNHRYEPTVEYFRQLLPHIHSSSILVFDDIHWSQGMEKAWEEIKAHEAVKYTIDVFHLGLVFFRDDFKVKQHFNIRFR